MRTFILFALAACVASLATHRLSNWWERAFATHLWSEVSPDGCLRVDAFRAFRVLPSVFHRIPHPDPTVKNKRGMRWDAVIFKRGYEVSTGELLGESIVYDPSSSFDFTYWGDADSPGRRVVDANGFPMVDTPRCADPQTLENLRSFYRRRQMDAQAKLEKRKSET